MRNYLTPRVLAQVVDENDTIIEKSINVDDVYIAWKFLANAWNDSFSLSKEKRLLMEEMFDTAELYHPEEYFLPPDNILPFKNGYFNLDDGTLHSYGGIEYKGFLYQLDANYLAKDADGVLPSTFAKLVWNGISNPAYSCEVNSGRYNAFLDYPIVL